MTTNRKLGAIVALLCFAPIPTTASERLPEGFAYLADVAPSITQHMRYAGNHNFIGRPIEGYDEAACILTSGAAEALAAAAAELEPQGLGLRVYDCYRPQRAVDDFARWAEDINDLTMQTEFYPRVDKARLFELGYIAERSGHSRGSTVDLAIEPLGHAHTAQWQPGDELIDCSHPDRFDDGVLEFGTGYDCFDVKAHHGAQGITEEAAANRELLKELMLRHGFKLYPEEWWHYTLVDEPFPDTYFDFPVTAP
jgi:D-alanyl-D-alanine dipeptidase